MIEFKNLRLYRWDGPEGRTYWNELFLRRPFLPVGPQNETSEGWAPPFGDDEAIADVGGHWLAHWVREERLLPASVVKAEAEQQYHDGSSGQRVGNQAFQHLFTVGRKI